MDPYASNVFASSYAAVEQFNPQRYYAESGMTPGTLPTGTTGPARGSAAPTPLGMYIPFIAIGVLIWALEKHKLRIFGKRK